MRAGLGWRDCGVLPGNRRRLLCRLNASFLAWTFEAAGWLKGFTLKTL
jgi:hypothetical protein